NGHVGRSRGVGGADRRCRSRARSARFPEDDMTTHRQTIWLHCGRTLRGWSRTPAVIANGFAMPILMLLIVLLIFGRSIETVSPVDPIARLVPLMVCAGVMFAAIASSVALVIERETGLLERFATLPNPSLA